MEIGIYDDLGKILKKCGAIKFGDFTLASGKKSKYYDDIKTVITNPKILKLITHQILKVMQIECIKPNYIGCVESGSIPIGTSISLETGLNMVIVRKKEKEHGIKDRIIGNLEKGKTVLILEDVTTTGGTAIDAVNILREYGATVKDIITVVDRDEGAINNLAAIGVTLSPLVSMGDIFPKRK